VAGTNSVSVIDAQNDSVLRNLTMQPIGPSTAFVAGVAAPSATRMYVTLSGAFGRTSATRYLDAATGAILAEITTLGALGRDASGTPVYGVSSLGLTRVVDGTPSTVRLEPDVTGTVATAVLTDPCGFEATASPKAFGLGGGSGTLTIPAPAGCSWTLDAGGVSGLSLSGTTSGTGPATRAFTVGPAAAPDFGTIEVGRQSVSIEHTSPLMALEGPSAGLVPSTFSVSGWAIDQNVAPAENSGIDAIHVWAYPVAGAPLFAASGDSTLGRADVAGVYGERYRFSGFSIQINSLPPGTYTLVCFAHSARSGTFSNSHAVTVTVAPPPPPLMALDRPVAGATVTGTFPVSGWALDPADPSTGTGIDVVHAWAYPAAGGAPIFVGQGTVEARADVAALFGSRYLLSGFFLNATLPPGSYTLAVFARSVTSQQFNVARTASITVAAPTSVPRMSVDTPVNGAMISGVFSVQGWALDLAAPSGSGVDAVHVWAYPVPAPGGGGSTPQFVGAGVVVNRPDVASVFGSRYGAAGFATPPVALAPGTYQLVVSARSVVTGTFNNATTITIVVQWPDRARWPQG
jgi:hypothetical protein